MPASAAPASVAPASAALVSAARESALAWLPAVLLMLASLVGAAGVLLRPPAIAGAAVAAVFPPWWPSGRILAAVAASGGDVLRQGGWTNIFVIIPKPNPAPANLAPAGLQRGSVQDGEHTGEFPQKLREAGAWLVVNPIAVGGCFEEKS